jgi:hypothetical protein
MTITQRFTNFAYYDAICNNVKNEKNIKMVWKGGVVFGIMYGILNGFIESIYNVYHAIHREKNKRSKTNRPYRIKDYVRESLDGVFYVQAYTLGSGFNVGVYFALLPVSVPIHLVWKFIQCRKKKRLIDSLCDRRIENENDSDSDNTEKKHHHHAYAEFSQLTKDQNIDAETTQSKSRAIHDVTMLKLYELLASPIRK